MKRNSPDLSRELELWQAGFEVVGVDEVGRGALAGPVYVGAYCLRKPETPEELQAYLDLQVRDCKQLLPERRKKLFTPLNTIAKAWSVQSSSVEYIDTFGIVEAVRAAIRVAVSHVAKKLNSSRIFLLADAFKIPGIVEDSCQEAIIKGDEKIFSIAAASVVAKVLRDEYMVELGRTFSAYNFEKNKGYGTKDHREALLKYGKESCHRALYVRKIFGA